jgi:2-desacetyl-2-hydroxyethyl bacteriochlorophyllide A dehydrogenase
MKAIVKTKREPGVEVQDRVVPEVTDTDILVKVKAASVCGSDVHVFEWTPSYEFMPLPVILGHEFAGEVVSIGSKIKTVAVGDRITAMPGMSCSRCAYCQVGRPDLCRNRISLGLAGDGAFAEYIKLPANATTFKLPATLSFEAASLTEPLSVVLRAVDLALLRVGQTAAVLGPGPIGLLTTQIVRLSGVSLLMVAGAAPDTKRLAVAIELGADLTIDVTKEDPVKKASSLTRRGFDVVLEASGSPRSVSQAVAMVKPGGKVILIGIHPAPGEIPTTEVVRQSKSIIGAYGYDADIWNRALTLLNTGKVKTEPMITHRLPLTEATHGFELLVKKEATKVIFIP